MANSTADGSVVIDVDMNVSQAEKRLGKFQDSIKKTEQEVSDMTKAKEEAQKKSVFQAAELDAEKAKLQEIKDRLQDIRNMAKDKGIDLDTREGLKAQIPEVREELSDQQTRVRALQAEWSKTENSVERYSQKIEAATQKLDKQKTEAGILTQQIDETAKAQSGMAGAIATADKMTDRFMSRIKKLASRVFVFTMITAALRSMRTWMGKAIRTNSDATAAIARLKGALLTLAQPLVEVVIPAFTALVNVLANVAAAVASVLSTLFGTTAKQSAEAAEGLYNETNALNKTGAAAKKASKSMAAFDEINQLSGGADGGGGGAGTVSTITPDFSIMDTFSERLKDIAKDVAFIGAGFALWKIGSALPGMLGKIATNLGLIMIAIGGLLIAWDGLTDAWENGVDWLNLIEMVGGLALAAGALYKVLGPIAAGITLVVGGLAMLVTGLHDAAVNGWNLQNLLLSMAGILATGIGISLLTGTWIPLLIAGIASILLAITVAYGEGENLIAGLKLILQGFVDFFIGVFTGDIERAIKGVGEIFDGLKGVFSAVINAVEKMFLSFLDWLDKKTGGRFTEIINMVKGIVSASAEFIRNTIGSLIDGLKQIFSGLVMFISGVFTGDWHKAWEGVKEIFKGAWNGIVGALEAAVNFIIRGINSLINALNSISFDFPDWVPGIGGKSFGINIPLIPEAELPRLATGAVIPPNREFMAVLGDQRQGNNIEAPESLIRRIVREEAGKGNWSQTVVIEIDKQEFGRFVMKYGGQASKRIGASLVGV